MSGQPGFPGFPGGFDPSALGQVFGQLQRIFSAPQDEGPVNWSLAREVALETVESGGGRSSGTVAQTPRIGFGSASPGRVEVPTPAGGDVTAVAEAARVADLWLDEVTSFPATGAGCEAWTPQQWIDRTMPTWRQLVAPVAERMAGAMTSAMPGSETGGALPPGVPPEAAAIFAQAGPMLQRLGGGLLGMQLGQAIGAMAREVVGAFDVGYPLAGGACALLPGSVAAAARDTGLDAGEVRLFQALRELAHARLFASAPWLAPTLLAGIERYAAGIQVDLDRIRDTVSGLDPTNPAGLQEALSSGILEPAETEEQRAALTRLEFLLALVEGWVETVTAEAARRHVPHADALLEHQRRRRAVGGPAERTFGALVGLELRPRHMREAAAWWAQRTSSEGTQERDRLWSHPDLLPEDFGAPGGQAAPGSAETGDQEGGSAADKDAAMDAELRRMLDDGAPDDPPGPATP